MSSQLLFFPSFMFRESHSITSVTLTHICGMWSGSHRSPVSIFATRSVRTPIKVYLNVENYVLYLWALIKFIGSPTSVLTIFGCDSRPIISPNVCYITNLPFSFVTRGPPESPKHIIPFSCPVTLPNAQIFSLCTL